MLVFKKSGEGIKAYSDADYANDCNDRLSYSGYVVMLGGSVSWKSKKQPRVSCSTVEAECRAMSFVTREMKWFRMILVDIRQE
ncbi:Ty1/Copia family ribonuclease HI, partial [Acinetobacter lactucae]